MRQSLLIWSLAIYLLTIMAKHSAAAGGPESLFLVVNSNSDASKEIANHYIRLRKLSPRNVLYIDWKGSTTAISGTKFRDLLLEPIINAIDERKVGGQIEYIVYSSDFPYRVDFRKEFESEKLPSQFRPIASLTGATYLWVYSMDLKPSMVMPDVNWYVPQIARKNQAACSSCENIPTNGFKARLAWPKSGGPTADRSKGQMYLLSTMLGVTIERGNTTKEILRYLTGASLADASRPEGTFYFYKNNNVRSKTRHNCYDTVADLLRNEGAKAFIQFSKTPKGVPDALGIMAGTEALGLQTNKPTILPGAICDHLTSYGGVFDKPFQSKLSEWLRAGAAGASGTVAEPYAIQCKFPLPIMHVHYRRGTSLAEAFYQSISCPYQLLIVGDALCQPWAKPPTVEVTNIKPWQTIRGDVKLQTKVAAQPGTELANTEVYIDGRLLGILPPQAPINLTTKNMGAGWHELRVVAITKDSIGFRGRKIVPFYFEPAESAREPESSDSPEQPGKIVDGNGGPIKLQLSPSPIVAADSTVEVSVSGPAEVPGFAILQNSRVLSYVAGNSGKVTLSTKELGKGPIRLFAQVAESADTPLAAAEKSQRSPPAWILVK